MFGKKKPQKSAEKPAEKVEKVANAAAKSDVALAEEKILAFWRERNIFQKSLDKPSPAGNYVFYDGPPFATGLPHYGHILVSTIKDAVPRYWTMRGKHVERRWGWDCHGLPIENIVEKDLKVSGKKEIEALPGGVEQFNEYARSKVLDYVDHWRGTVERMGRWVDFDGSYKTMDNSFIESVWWALKEMWDKKLIYEGTKVLPYCPRCETPISSSEIAMDNSYKDITDISVYVELQFVDEPDTAMIAWTTTPWTLPGNTAAAVNKVIDYVRVRTYPNAKLKDYIIAKASFEKLQPRFTNPEIVEEFKGEKLVGRKYKPIFNFFTGEGAMSAGKKIANPENGWKVYAAPYVTTEAGTGIVHLAPGYGEEDMELAKKFNIPFVLHVGPDGKFTRELAVPLEDDAHTVLAGLRAKPKPTAEDPNFHQSSDILILKHLAKVGLLFAKEKIVHPYPHCHRCETPLYYFALRAWFVAIQAAKKDMLAQNENIHWVPEHLKHGRFGKGIETAPDWNISRNRYWASPLPFWHCDTCGKTECIGSLAELKERTKAHNTYFIMRHGESDANVANIVSSHAAAKHHLTDAGKKQAAATAEKIRDEKIDLIVSSDLVRTRETAEIVAKTLGLTSDAVVHDERLRELQVGDFDGKLWTEYHAFFANREARFTTTPAGGETLLALQRRVMETLYDLETKYAGKKILIVSHGDPMFFMKLLARGVSQEDIVKEFVQRSDVMGLGEYEPLPFSPYPHNRDFALDFHRPYIDDVVFACSCGAPMKRIPEVVDGWFESGSMPFAQHHYPFENKEKFDATFPAQFIVEYIAQTRTWFYYTHTTSVLLFGKNSFENVVATGTVLAEDGQKMSKSKGNFPDPTLLFNKYGVDALRFYMLSSPLMKSEDLFFSEKGVDEAYKKMILRLKNVVSFYDMYKPTTAANATDIHLVLSRTPVPAHVLDRWILARLNSLIMFVTQSMDAYEIDRALAPIDTFLEDLSTWYLRRSRDRLKDEHAAALEKGGVVESGAVHTFFYTLREFSKVIAPFMPFIAEEVYKQLVGDVDALESVHLETWPDPAVVDEAILGDMAETRRVVGFALEARARAGIKVRQPLATVVLKDDVLKDKNDLLDLIIDEVNVKDVEFDPGIATPVVIDTKITPALQEEGNVRDFIRAAQEARKKAGRKPGELVTLVVSTGHVGEAFVKKFTTDISKTTFVSEIVFEKIAHTAAAANDEIVIDGEKFVLGVR